jgi:drug/metabolite transporter (DMT)-like permease
MKPVETAMLVMLSLVWGSAFLFVEVVVEDVRPLTIVAGRLLVAALVLAPAAAIARGGILPRRLWPAMVFIAVFNNVIPFTLITSAQEHIPSSLAAALIGTNPLFTLVIASAIGAEKVDTGRVGGLVAGFVGAVVLIGPDLGEITSSSTVAQLAVLCGSVCYAVSTVAANRTAEGAALSLAAGQMIVAAAISIPLALALDGLPDTGIGGKAALAWLALGIFSSGVAYILFYSLVKRVTATQVAVVSYLIPIVATLLGWLVLDEALSPRLWLGLALIVGGVAAVNGGLQALWQRARGAQAPSGAAAD